MFVTQAASIDGGGTEVLPNCDSPRPKTDRINDALKFPFSLSLSPLNLE